MSQVLWAGGVKGCFDQGLLMHAVSGRLWPGIGPWDEYPGLIGPSDEPSLVIFHGESLANPEGIDYMLLGLNRLRGAVYVQTGDETLAFPGERLRAAGRRYLLPMYNPHRPLRPDRKLMYSWPEDTRAWLRMQPRLAASARQFKWSFMGQAFTDVRRQMVEALYGRSDGYLLTTAGYTQGLPREEYFRILNSSCIVPCPVGPNHPDTHRTMEAMEAGALPVVIGRPPNGDWTGPDVIDYYAGFGIHVLPDSTWLGPLIDRYAADDRALQAAMTESLARWIGHKRRYAVDLADDLAAVGANLPERNPITVIIPTSPVPSHPSVDMLADTIAKVRAYPELRDAEILLLVDGVRPDLEHRRDAYEEYKRVAVDRANWDEGWFGTWPILFDGWNHQANMMREALMYVRTPYILFVEHDTHPGGEIPWDDFVAAMDQDESINYIRLSIFHDILPEHRHLYQGEREVAGVPLIHTTQFSARPHIARTSWYKMLLGRYFQDESRRAFIEDGVTSPAEAGELPGMFLYKPAGNILRSFTVNGRGDDAKAPHEVGR